MPIAYSADDGLKAVPWEAPTAASAGKVSVLMERHGAKFLLFLPASWTPPAAAAGGQEKKEEKHPVLLFLHGAGGIANEANVRGQSLTRLCGRDADFAAGFPFIVLTPVLPSRGWEQGFAAAAALVGMAVAELGGDAARCYVAGQSMGGCGAMNFAARHAGSLAALVQCCGYLDRDAGSSGQGSDAARGVLDALAAVPTWCFHSADDAVVDVSHSDDVVAALKERGNKDVKYTRYDTAPGVPRPDGTELKGHASFELAFAEKELYPWLLTHTNKDPKPWPTAEEGAGAGAAGAGDA